MSAPTWNPETCAAVERLFENAKRRKEDELQTLLERCFSEQEKLALEELYREVI